MSEDGSVGGTARTGRSRWTWLRLGGGLAVVAVVVARVGTGAVWDGVRATSLAALMTGLVLTAVTTLCSAWRWCLVARGLGVELALWPAVAAYYRAQFLNTALPGGVLGDVHRGVAHGTDTGDVGRGLRAVAWERLAGQVVQVALAVVVLLVAPSPVRSAMPLVVVGVAGLVGLGAVAAHPFRRGTSTGGIAWGWPRSVRSEVRRALLARGSWPGVVVMSVLVVAGHVAAFMVAVRAAGVHAPATTLLPLGMLVLLAMSVPLNIGGWGPREGVAAWAFGAAGLGSAHGLAASTVYGVMVFVATLPGAAVLASDAWRRQASRRRRRRRRVSSTQPAAGREPLLAGGRRG